MNRAFWFLISLAVLGVAAAAWLFFWVENDAVLRVSAAVDALLLIGLVIITAYYAGKTGDIAAQTSELAKATRAMAEEAQRSRQDAFRPIIDILDFSHGTERIRQALHAEGGSIPNSVVCVLRNVGVGPALHVHIPVHYPDVAAARDALTIPTLQAADILVDLSGPGADRPDRYVSNTLPAGLVLRTQPEKETGAGHYCVTVTYQDVFGRHFKSSMIVQLSEGAVLLGPLQYEDA